jgi:GNAT superfamily N-acetyltransferase
MPTIRIRKASAADAAALAALRYEFRVAYGTTLTEPRAAFVRRCTRWMRRALDERRWHCWVAVSAADRTIVGTLWMQPFDKVPNPGAEAEQHAYISNVYVRPEARGGTGRRLLETALAWCRTHRVDSVILWPSGRSRPLYERAGFRATKELFELALD